MLVIITGAIGIGKTTVCQKVIRMAESRGYTCGGIVTYKTRDKGITIEDIQSGRSMPLASVKNVYRGPHTGRYYFNPEGIDFGIRAIDKGRKATILVVDEMGPLELTGEGFASAIELVRSGKVRNCITVIRSGLLSTLLPRLGGAPLVFETTIDNRDQLPEKIGLGLALTELV